MTVVVEFHTAYRDTDRKFRPGRCAVALFRLPHEDCKSENPVPQPIGYAPYSLQSPNLPDAMGRIVIVHRPLLKPIRPGTFQVQIGSASETKYSLHVTCKYAHVALPTIEDEVSGLSSS